MRTFSKAYGLAGLRVGYGLMHPALADILNRVRQPFNVNSLALVAATAALDDMEFVARSYAANLNGLRQLGDGIERARAGRDPVVRQLPHGARRQGRRDLQAAAQARRDRAAGRRLRPAGAPARVGRHGRGERALSHRAGGQPEGMSAQFQRVAIIGVGLIGGSFALALKAARACGSIVGVGRNPANLARARALGVIDAEAAIRCRPRGAPIWCCSRRRSRRRPNSCSARAASGAGHARHRRRQHQARRRCGGARGARRARGAVRPRSPDRRRRDERRRCGARRPVSRQARGAHAARGERGRGTSRGWRRCGAPAARRFRA